MSEDNSKRLRALIFPVFGVAVPLLFVGFLYVVTTLDF